MALEATAEEAVRRVEVQWQIAPKLNFACHQSAFPVLRDLSVGNADLEHSLEDLLVTISADPAFLKPRNWRIDRIAPAGMVAIRQRDLELDGGLLLGLDDAIRGTVALRVERHGEVLAEERRPVELLGACPSKWIGLDSRRIE